MVRKTKRNMEKLVTIIGQLPLVSRPYTAQDGTQKVFNSRGFILSDSVSPEGKGEYLTSLFRRSDPVFLRTFSGEIDSLVTDCLAMHPQDSSLLMAAGIYYYGTSRAAEAKAMFGRNKDLYPNSVSAVANYIELLMYNNEWEELSVEGRRAFRRFPSEPGFLEMASLADYAYKAYDAALKIDPTYVPVLNNYAYFLSMEGKRLNKAYAMSKITVEKEPDNPTYLDTFGWILYLQGKALEAKPFFKHAMLYGGKDSVVILDHYAEVLYALKEYDLAFVYWAQAKSKNNGEIEGLDEKIMRRKSEMEK